MYPPATPPEDGNVAAAPIIGPAFCCPYPIDLYVVRKVLTITDGNFAVTDFNGNVMFKVKEPSFGLHEKRVLLDAYGIPVATLKQKMISLHDRWQVFRGDSTEARDLLYTVKRTSLLQAKTKLDVFLASNEDEKACDFKVEGSWLERSCVVSAGGSKSVVAQMHKKYTIQSAVMGMDNFAVTVYPSVDFAFIVSLIVILDDD